MEVRRFFPKFKASAGLEVAGMADVLEWIALSARRAENGGTALTAADIVSRFDRAGISLGSGGEGARRKA
jgi:hypothetical protein